MDEGDKLILLDDADEDGDEVCGWGASLSREDDAQEVLDIVEVDRGRITVESPGGGELGEESSAERNE
ncbi:hypothetical protein TRAPUB_11449 [Trametes pubescens]|uniref:Uncharacterized protein n=1 Tax=Trametes pubescens TaxID=154538 RepID=A0A1M2VWL6_TRAPU|nr:hypothetical protein TRAPUB_11449 [Trametes pubescens]